MNDHTLIWLTKQSSTCKIASMYLVLTLLPGRLTRFGFAIANNIVVDLIRYDDLSYLLFILLKNPTGLYV